MSPDRRSKLEVRDLVRDERGALSSARVGMWCTVALAYLTVLTDIVLTVATTSTARIPNTVYGLLGTMFMAFAGWAAGPRISQYWGKPGEAGAALAQAVRDPRLPSKHDDERYDG